MTKEDEKFLRKAEIIATKSKCIRENRNVGAIAVQNGNVVATGFNGASDGEKPCGERGYCIRTEKEIPTGERLEIANCIHAEQALICNAANDGISLNGSTVYVTLQPCPVCSRMLKSAGVARIVFRDKY